MSEKTLVREANELLRQLNREVFDGNINIENLPIAVELVCNFAEKVTAEGKQITPKVTAGEPSSAPPAAKSETILREALQKIADNYGDCRCDHSTADCCENPAVGEFCPHCIAELAIARSGAAQEVSPAQPGKGEAMNVTLKLTIAFIVIGLGATIASHDYFAGMLQVSAGSFLAAVVIAKAIGRGGVTR